MEKNRNLDLGFIVLLLAGALLLQQVWATWRQTETIPYSEFQTLLREQKFAEVAVADQYVRGTLKEPLKDNRTIVVAVRVPPDLARDLTNAGVAFSGIAEGGWLTTLLGWVVPALIFFWLWRIALGRVAGSGLGGLMTIG
ncbi:ATP-dependent metallopeptidase FtsH/Yme1/Tma family protein, partial [Nostoc sp. NIES-2111]